LYVFKAIIGTRTITPDLILGGLSCIFWTLTLQTTIKYVIITLRADNRGEGGIFALFSLVRRKSPWLVIPAIDAQSAAERIIRGKIIYNFAFVAACGPLQTLFSREGS
jgi:K+ transporter